MIEPNICLLTDSYKATHWKQYPSGTSRVYSYFESRGGKFPVSTLFGLQAMLRNYYVGLGVLASEVKQAKEFWEKHFGADLFNFDGWMRIVEEHGGRLPISIKAVPEGLVVPTRNVLMTIENTDPSLPWLTNWLETHLVQCWFPSTVAISSRAQRATIKKWLERNGDPAGLDFKLHDFGYRGVSSLETAALGGAAHLLSFNGTDTVAGIQLAQEWYSGDWQFPSEGPMYGFSIPASEHSTMTSWGEDREIEAMRNMLEQYPTGLVACVSDSFDIWRACSEYWGKELKHNIMERDGTLVVRPDSGELPVTVLRVLDCLGKAFGTTFNEKGYKVLPPQVRVIQGDGIDGQMVHDILEEMDDQGWSADNIAFGSGGGLLQKHDRDTQKFAFKCSAIEIDGEWHDVWKDPVTDPGKKSKRGRLKLVADGDGYKTVREEEPGEDLLVEVFRDGQMLVEHTFEEIRGRIRA